jgi:peptidoglycan/xylan/chitin deacetylase (PgdA/CDA1 family)
MTTTSTALDWASVDPFLRGPWTSADASPTARFLVPGAPAGGFVFGRVVSGAAWPPEIPPLDRLAAVPCVPAETEGAAEDDIVLGLALDGRAPTPLCVRAAEGAVAWAVDPAAWIRGILAQEYVTRWRRPLPSRVPLFDYSALPSVVKGLLARLQDPRAATRSNPIAFPSLPVDDFVDTLRRLCATLAFGAAVRRVPLWPGGRQAAATVCHDLDTPWILDERRRALLREILDTEGSLGFRSAWFVTARTLDRARHGRALERLRAAGCEVGAHGWRHDARLGYLPPARQAERLDRAAARLLELGGTSPPGMRTPWYCSSPSLFDAIAPCFAYDSSVVNASAFFSIGSNSGCATLFPYRPRPDLCELPLSLPPDTAFDPATGAATLGTLADAVIERGGVVVLTFHPQPHQSANPRGLRLHRDLLAGLDTRHGDHLWRASPAEIVRCYEQALGGLGGRDPAW